MRAKLADIRLGNGVPLMAEVTPPRAYRFGVFELDKRTGELRKHGIRVKL